MCSMLGHSREDAYSRTGGIFIRDTVYFIVIQWSMTLCFIESQWHMPYPVWKCLLYGGMHPPYCYSNLLICYATSSILKLNSDLCRNHACDTIKGQNKQLYFFHWVLFTWPFHFYHNLLNLRYIKMDCKFVWFKGADMYPTTNFVKLYSFPSKLKTLWK